MDIVVPLVAVGAWMAANAAILIIGGVMIAGTVVTIWATRKGEASAKRSISESEQQRKLAEKSLEFQEGVQDVQKSQFTTNVVLGILGIIVSVVTLIAMLRKK